MMFQQEHLELQRSVRKLIESEINPHVDEWEQVGQFPAHEVFKKFGQQGLLGINKPERFGGLGLDYTFSIAFTEALGNIRCGGVPLAIGVQTDMATPALAKHGSDALRAEFLEPAIAGDLVACIGVSEPSAGSDVSRIKTQARKDGGDYVINGGKMWITNGAQADWMCMLANTSDGPLHKSKSLICVPLKSRGVTIARKLDKLGMRSSDTAQIFFEEVRVPQRNRIGEEGLGFVYQMEQFQEERLWSAASQLRPLEQAIADTIEYTQTREAFGRRLIDNQAIRFRLSELQTQVELLRSLIYRAATEYIAGVDVTTLASMAKLASGRIAREVADSCLQYYGGMGFMNETPISRLFRDARVASIGGGADEIMLEIISKRMGMTDRKA
ncbi:acyl-CoA dehydrogenase family protein [Pseudorhodoplanes sp.]|uniref:acyl-CoA dehydrogenase family protein n=1 Tax=Pseudorhodoplanes sp. TaxID=1934341 RepID=UPI003D0C57B1